MTGVGSLTPSERRVAELAAEGMTNREIAQALFVTLRTVQVHLTHSYQKLAIASREELPEALAPGEVGGDAWSRANRQRGEVSRIRSEKG